ncbi:MAG: 2-amino-4-hydroxy-6-hydroxymethyldihydropteridine diphosphokinase [Gammaproteobacteria bacterium]|nr:2-amino-4-hydroxy-6-hydroxymethyldihydropteridine diphosphokinase [Gammaproteobacteria bacterium]MDH5501710.1 2-amino-4-hydroxy-6-hydroxymethyldihydropteridine diphosphokinase [Gammaproteobacteria bacterium]
MNVPRPHWWPAYVGIGSNLDDPRQQVANAITALGSLRGSRLIRASRLYRSPPMDGTDQPDYINAVAALLTQREVPEFLHELQSIERTQGRKRTATRWAARTLDLDLLVFGDRQICNDELTVPHPGIAKRSFVLHPLCEIAPTLRVPGMATVQQLCGMLRENETVLSVLDDQKDHS